MQANAWFIQNVKDSREPGADLGCQPDSLRFTAGKRTALPIECEISETNLDEKLQAGLNFAHNITDDGPLLRSQLQSRNKAGGGFGCQLAKLMNVQLARAPIFYGDGQDFRFEPCTVAYFASFVRHECSNAVASKFALSLLV